MGVRNEKAVALNKNKTSCGKMGVFNCSNHGSRHFQSEGYYVSTVGLNKKTVANYIKNQELEDQLSDKRSLKEYKDPFTGK